MPKPTAAAPKKARSINQTTAGSALRVIVKTALSWERRPCLAGSASLALGAALRAMCEQYFPSGEETAGFLAGSRDPGQVGQFRRDRLAPAGHRLGPQPARAVRRADQRPRHHAGEA